MNQGSSLWQSRGSDAQLLRCTSPMPSLFVLTEASDKASDSIVATLTYHERPSFLARLVSTQGIREEGIKRGHVSSAGTEVTKRGRRVSLAVCNF